MECSNRLAVRTINRCFRYKWSSQFFDECCILDPDGKTKSGEFYTAYRSYCMQVGDYIRSTTDFYTALEAAGFVRRKTSAGIMVSGLRLKSDFME